MRSIAELPVEDIEAEDVANGAGDANVEVSLAYAPEIVPLARPWLTQIGLTTDEYEPLWLGPLVRRRGEAVSATYRLKATQWEGYLARLWLPDDYDDGGIGDPAAIIANRVQQAAAFARDRFPASLPVPLPLNTPALTGREVDFEFSSTYDGRDWWKSRPPSVLDDIQLVGEQGFVFGFIPHLDGGVWSLSLEVQSLPHGESTVLQVGYDLSEIELSSDGEQQITDWWVVGEGEVARATDTDGLPVLMDVRSYDSIPADANLRPIADALIAATARDLIAADRVRLKGIRQIVAGDLVTIDIPPGLYQTWPDGSQWTMRARSVTWRIDATQSSTSLSVEQQLENVSPWALQPNSLTGLINDLRTRLLRTETRRVQSLSPVITGEGGQAAKWHHGEGPPSEVPGANVGDYYLDIQSGEVYKLDADGRFNLTAAPESEGVHTITSLVPADPTANASPDSDLV
jgi:hypothetical protein